MKQTTFTWHDYLRFSESVASSSDEATLRSAISRAYYAAFHAGRDLCRELEIAVDAKPIDPGERDHSVHARVARALVAHKHPRLRHAGEVLDALRKLRNDADYRLSFDGDVKAAANKAVRDAHRVLGDLDLYRRSAR
jgi:uncharacterized protein (UPF0332 family)